MCINCEKFDIGQANSNFKIRFMEQEKDLIYGEGCSNFSSHAIKEGHEKKNSDNIILHKENNHKKSISWKR